MVDTAEPQNEARFLAGEAMNAYAHIVAVEKVVHQLATAFVDTDDGRRREPGEDIVIIHGQATQKQWPGRRLSFAPKK